jgi:hypothetical protein
MIAMECQKRKENKRKSKLTKIEDNVLVGTKSKSENNPPKSASSFTQKM